MPSSSSRRLGLRSRREPDPQHSDADTPDSIATPSRKRRRLNGSDQQPASTTPRTRITESVASNDSNATLPNAADTDIPTDPIERQNHIINHLRVPTSYSPHAAFDYANDVQIRKMEGENVAAFAKVAARDWCFFVQKTRVIIGRSEHALRPRLENSQSVLGGLVHSDDPVGDWGVDIDLGPERQVSRIHAEIDYDSSAQTWYVSVNSRNGLKLDDMTLGKGQRAPLHSGVCIGIMGTQMLFLLASQEDAFHPMLWRQVKTDREVNESDEDGPARTQLRSHAHPAGPTPKRDYDPFPPTSARNRQLGNHLQTTPKRSQTGTPLPFRSSEKERLKGSPTVYRGMMLDSADDVEYSKDSAKDIKPPHSYAQLIGQAILSSPEEMLTLANIYDYIKSKYAFFRHAGGGWQNSIRHNLSLNKSFEKVARRTDEPGKGMKWKIADAEKEEFVKKQMLNPRKGGGLRMDTSGPSSPAQGQFREQREMRDQPLHATARLQSALDEDVFHQPDGAGRPKSSQRSTTPPLSSIPMANESFTPERGPGRFVPDFKPSPSYRDSHRFATPAKRLDYGEGEAGQPSFMTAQESSPGGDAAKTPLVRGLRNEAAHSPPPLYSDAAAHQTQSTQGESSAHRGTPLALVTPLVPRHAPRLAPPSTAQVPSQYMNFSSPAPFWKYVNLPSTPAVQHIDFSPIKDKHEQDSEEKDSEDRDSDEGGVDDGQRSSPPVLMEEGSAEEAEGEVRKKRRRGAEHAGIDGDDESNKDVDMANEDNDNHDKAELEPSPPSEEEAPDNSPSRTLSRPVSSRLEVGAGVQSSRSMSRPNGLEARHAALSTTTTGGMVRGVSIGSLGEEEEGGEETFDLSKGFQKIGSFHRSLAQAHGVMGGPRASATAQLQPTSSHEVNAPVGRAGVRAVNM